MSLREAVRVFLRHPSVWVLLVICIGFWGVRIGVQTPVRPWEVALGLAVMAYWPVQEWWMHRWLLHLGPVTVLGRTLEPGFTRAHRLHHEAPDDLTWVFLPVGHILMSLVGFTSIGALISRDLPATCVFMGCASASTLLYEWTHYLTHTPYRPKSRYYRSIWQLHRWHHFKHEGYWFSFTVPFIDGWLGTGPDPKQVKRSPTARTLGGDPMQRAPAPGA